MSFQVPPVVYRILKGAPLSAAEGDQNLKTLVDFCNALAALYGISFNNDGTLLTDSVTTLAIKDRAVTQAKLDWTANFFATASGTNAYAITISPTAAYTAGDGTTTAFWCFVKFTNANTAAATIAVNGSPAVPIKKLVSSDLAAGDISAGSIHALYFDGTNFQVPSITNSNAVRTAVYATQAIMAANMEVMITKPAGTVWQDMELDYIGQFSDTGPGGGTAKIDFSYQTAPEVGVAPGIGGTIGTGNGAATFNVSNNDDRIVGHWMHRGVITENLVTTDSITLRAARTITVTPESAYFMCRAWYQ